jgi:hypothetical protein
MIVRVTEPILSSGVSHPIVWHQAPGLTKPRTRGHMSVPEISISLRSISPKSSARSARSLESRMTIRGFGGILTAGFAALVTVDLTVDFRTGTRPAAPSSSSLLTATITFFAFWYTTSPLSSAFRRSDLMPCLNSRRVAFFSTRDSNVRFCARRASRAANSASSFALHRRGSSGQ